MRSVVDLHTCGPASSPGEHSRRFTPVEHARRRRYSRRPANGRKRSRKAQIMKIVAFEGQGAARLGVVEGDQAIDLQAVDSNAPADLGEWLAKNNGDVKPLAELAKRAPASARKPL